MKNAKEEKKMHEETREKIKADHKLEFQERKWAVKVEEVPPIHELPIEDRFEILKQACDEQEIKIKNQAERIRYLEGATNHATGTPLSKALAELAKAREALDEIRTLAHCISKAGPLHTPTLDDAWAEFDRISVNASRALHAIDAARKAQP
jgi:hypothetical protein